MADLAHDASGPASSEPAGIALKQAGRPASSDRGKLRVFISYSRDDLDFADQLTAALDFSGFECFIDREGISGGEEWKRSLGGLISDADTVVFVLTPNSAHSAICDWEVGEATRLNKRILPIVCRPLEGVSPPPRLRELNYIFFYKEPKVPGSGFGTGLAKLVTALNTDFDWLREHTRYLQRAIEWDTGGRPANRLLSGNDIREAEAWAVRRPKTAPEPTALQLEFIRASEEEAEARLSEKRKQLEAVAAAQAARETALHDREEAVKQAADAQRRRARIRNIALVVVSILAMLAGWLGWSAEKQRKLAEQQRITAEEQRHQADAILARATNIISNLQKAMDTETNYETFELFKAGAEHGDATSMRSVGVSYEKGEGVAQDYDKAREWYEKAVAKGDTNAMINLGLLYNNGHGVAQDRDKAREWFEKAATKDNANAMVGLGLLFEEGLGVAQDYDKAREWFEKAVAKGNAEGMVSLGALYDNGHGVAQDHDKAREWYEKAVAKGSANGMFILGARFANGQGVAQDYAKAREWFEKAAAKYNADAMINLGLLFASGRGVPQNYYAAREWYEKAAAQGDASAMMALDQLSIREAATAGQYDEALRLEEAFATKVEAEETKRDGKPGEQVATELSQVEWYALFAKQFTKALTVADRAHTLFPTNLLIETNRAHALMFVGREDEAKALYLAHKGELVSGAANGEGAADILWEQGVADDFAEFRKAGLTHPMMAAVEKELGISR
jgi:TPR repeat protein